MMVKQITEMFETCLTGEGVFQPTEICNEGWMLRFVIHWFSTQSGGNHLLSFPENGKWYSEALIHSPFCPDIAGINLAESWTYADGVIGHFAIGCNRMTDLSLLPEARHLIILRQRCSASYLPIQTLKFNRTKKKGIILFFHRISTHSCFLSIID